MEENTTQMYPDLDALYEGHHAEMVKQLRKNPFVIVLLSMCVVGCIANCLSVLATVCIPHGQTTHSKLIISLAMADIFLVFSVAFRISRLFLVPNHGYYYKPADHPDRVSAACTKAVDRALTNTALIASLLNLLTMAVDHNIAIMKPLYYTNLMSNIRGNIVIVVVWIMAVLGGFLDFIVRSLNSYTSAEPQNFCETLELDGFDIEVAVFVLIILVLIIMTYIYIRIYYEVKHIIARDHALQRDNMHSNKAVITTVLIVGTFIVCWVPYCVFQIAMLILLEENIEHVQDNLKMYVDMNDIFFTLMLSNSICDPVIYAIRLHDVQLGYKNILSKLFKHRRFSINEENYFRSRRNTDFLTDEETIETARCMDNNKNFGDETISNMTELTPISVSVVHPWDINDETHKKGLC